MPEMSRTKSTTKKPKTSRKVAESVHAVSDIQASKPQKERRGLKDPKETPSSQASQKTKKTKTRKPSTPSKKSASSALAPATEDIAKASLVPSAEQNKQRVVIPTARKILPEGGKRAADSLPGTVEAPPVRQTGLFRRKQRVLQGVEGAEEGSLLPSATKPATKGGVRENLSSPLRGMKRETFSSSQKPVFITPRTRKRPSRLRLPSWVHRPLAKWIYAMDDRVALSLERLEESLVAHFYRTNDRMASSRYRMRESFRVWGQRWQSIAKPILDLIAEKSPSPLRSFLQKITPNKLAALLVLLFCSLLLLVVRPLVLPSAPAPAPSPSASLPAPEKATSSGFLWDTKKGVQQLALPTPPPLPAAATSNYQDRAARSAEIARTQGRMAALDAAEREALLAPDDSSAQHHAGMLALNSGQRDKARRYFQSALRADPHAVGSLFNMAQMEFRDGNYTSALDHYRTLLKLKPGQDFPQYRVLLCKALLQEPVEIDDAIYPAGSLSGHYARAVVAAVQGQAEAMQKHIENAQTFFPGQTRFYDRDAHLWKLLLEKAQNPPPISADAPQTEPKLEESSSNP